MIRVNRYVYLAAGVVAAAATAGWSIHAMATPTAVVRNASATLSTPSAATSAVDSGNGVAGGYGGTDATASASPTTDANTGTGDVTKPSAGAGEVTASLMARTIPKMGGVVTDRNGFVLYRFDKDSSNPPASNCVASCAKTWPPVLTTGGTPAVAGIDRNLVGTVRRADGSRQLTIAGWPVYRYSGDTKSGAWKGQGLGGVWWVIAPSGKKNLTCVPTPTRTPVASPSAGGDGGNSGAGGGNNGGSGYGGGGNGSGDPKHW